MQAVTQRTVQHMLLPLLMVFVMYAIVISPDCLAEVQQQEIELGSYGEQGSSDDDKLKTGFTLGPTTNDLLSLCPTFSETLSPFIGSDAYPSSILHGPPTPEYPA